MAIAREPDFEQAITHGELCQRCGEVDEDRRTLHMACFYDMDELGLPFGHMVIRGRVQVRIADVPGILGPTQQFEDHPEADARLHHHYTLRVCKSCRASWMAAIKDWFATPKPEQQSTGTGVFLRKLGRTYEASPAEVAELTVRMKGSNDD